MQPDKIKKAKSEAQRFLKNIAELDRAKECGEWSCPKEHGALRRASMDLTRALAEMRKP